MVAIGVLLIIAGAFGIMSGPMAFGDIGIAIFLGGIVGLLAGIGFLVLNNRLKTIERRLDDLYIDRPLR